MATMASMTSFLAFDRIKHRGPVGIERTQPFIARQARRGEAEHPDIVKNVTRHRGDALRQHGPQIRWAIIEIEHELRWISIEFCAHRADRDEKFGAGDIPVGVDEGVTAYNRERGEMLSPRLAPWSVAGIADQRRDLGTRRDIVERTQRAGEIAIIDGKAGRADHQPSRE